MHTFKLIPYLALIATAACETTSSSDANPTPVLSFAELNTTNTSIINKIVSAGPSPADAIPDTGGATYDGAMTFLLQDGSADGVIGQAQVNVDFGTDLVTGGANNFYDLSGNAAAGSVSIENGFVVDALGNVVTGNVNGNVTFAAGAMDVSTTLAGNFSGPNVEFFSGVVSGTATPTGGSAIAVQGAIYTEQ
ncbi:hypothetical protein RCCS2_15419 [Roseobacter sp. CCS2]|nr:hypothetical protein RCCS2_15419 [Roseobacter sp. CCS2]